MIRCGPRTLAWLGTLLFLRSAAAAGPEVRFARDIRPILSDHCYQCHGPDEKARQAELRLDTRQGLFAVRQGRRAVASGDLKASELIRRIRSRDAAERMPPADHLKPLAPRQIELLEAWVAAGAAWEPHWSFVEVARPAPPAVKDAAWAQGPLDAFVLARLEREGLAPSPAAAPATWLRRVTLDLTGLPPTLAEQEAFAADTSREARATVVERLLASPHYGERMALFWLDLARYADTNGYNNDEERTMWVWRDWVIDAFNRNLGYDQFLIEQLAGDLLPNATAWQRVATGFNRNHVLTTEGGVIAEEYRVEYVADRVHTVASSLLGLSLQCARCHDHKYDPLTMVDYYRFFAYFNNVSDRTLGYNQGTPAEPFLRVPSQLAAGELEHARARRIESAAALERREAGADAALAAWEQSLPLAERERLLPSGLALHFALEAAPGTIIRDAVDARRQGTIRGPVKWTEGRIGGALEFAGQTHVELGEVAAFERTEPFSISVWVLPRSESPIAILSKMDDGAAYRGYDLLLEGGKPALHLVHQWPDNGLKVLAKQPLKPGVWQHLLATYDGLSRASGVKMFVDGKPLELETTNDSLRDTIMTRQPLRLGQRSGSLPYQGLLDDVQFFSLALTVQDAARLAAGQPVLGLRELLRVPGAERTAEQRRQLRRLYLESADAEYGRLRRVWEQAVAREAELEKSAPATMVMQELPDRRPTRMLRRGQYDQPGEVVEPGTPGCLPPLPAGAPPNRLALARWLVDPRHPLTARVMVNRIWQQWFGVGLVETVEDFGLQGAAPSHPELLDWLAADFVESGWDVKRLLRAIALSATYGQSSRLTPALLERDPANRLLARGPRFRLPAETVRDQALSAAGLLAPRLGGPSVRPPQPAGLWEEVSVERRFSYRPSEGADLYRRGLYTYWKRTCPPPNLSAFDAPDRETCVLRRARTNTPLQALILMNDPVLIEAARKLAERPLLAELPDDGARLERLFRAALARPPRAEESSLLLPVLQRARDRFRAEPAAAAKLLSVGAAPSAAGLDPIEAAAWTSLAHVLLCLDETITKD